MPDAPQPPPPHASPPQGNPQPQPTQPAKPQPKHPGMVTLTIDGVEVVAKPGTNLIEAANAVDIEIPFYCYHKRLTIAANCRMCLVKVSNSPKLQPGCQTVVAEGIAVTTNSAEVRDSQRSVQEFLLYNHPVDCAICDQAGECKLQDYYMAFDHKPARPTQPKVLRHKRKDLGPSVVLDQERCILCTRCVRFMREVAKEPQLGVFGRGNREYIDIFPGVPLTSKYSGNTVDICPVGALLSKDFRFKARAFFLTATPSICTGCSRGCNTYLDWYDRVSYRYRPRENDAVNQGWMCDDGRLTYHRLNEARVNHATEGGQQVSVGAALRNAGAKLGPHLKTPGLTVVVSPQLSNEDLLMVLLFAKDGLGASTIYEGGFADGDEDQILIKADKNPNRKGLALVAKAYGLTVKPLSELAKQSAISALYVAGAEVAADAELTAAMARAEVSVAQAFNHTPATAQAGILLPATPHSETPGSFTNFEGRVQRFDQAYPAAEEARPHWRLALELWIELGYVGRYSSARELFLDLGQRVPELAKVDWDDLGPGARQRPGIFTAPAAADARPAGYRERVLDLKINGLEVRTS
jgi:NADH-quinone oxidoreductase subunit G